MVTLKWSSKRLLMVWRGAVGGTGAVEVGQDVLAAADQDLCQCLDLLQPVRDGPLQRADEPSHQELSRPGSLGAIGLEPSAGRRPKWPGPERVTLVGKQGPETLALGVAEQAGPSQ